MMGIRERFVIFLSIVRPVLKNVNIQGGNLL